MAIAISKEKQLEDLICSKLNISEMSLVDFEKIKENNLCKEYSKYRTLNELVEIYNEVTQDHLENKLSDEEYENIINNIHIYKEQENYVRLRYLLMLLDKPQRKNKKFPLYKWPCLC